MAHPRVEATPEEEKKKEGNIVAGLNLVLSVRYLIRKSIVISGMSLFWISLTLSFVLIATKKRDGTTITMADFLLMDTVNALIHISHSLYYFALLNLVL